VIGVVAFLTELYCVSRFKSDAESVEYSKQFRTWNVFGAVAHGKLRNPSAVPSPLQIKDCLVLVMGECTGLNLDKADVKYSLI
jgi:hypothetical protein